MLSVAAFVWAAGAGAVLSPSGDGYVNPKTCFGCHADTYRSYLKTGMGRSFGKARAENAVGDFTVKNRFHHEASDTWFEMVRRGDQLVERRYQIGYEGRQSNVEETPVDYFLGSGLNARAFLRRNPQGGLTQLPVVWYSENGGHWGMAPGYDSPGHPFEQRPITYDCMFCHNAYPAIPASHARLGDEPVFSGDLPEGIDCQRCHGPGRAHVESSGRRAGSIVNPAHLNPDRQAEVCYQCHLQTTGFSLPHAIKRYERGDYSYRPGEPLGDFEISFGFAPGSERDQWFQNVTTATRMRMSQCFLKSGGKLECITCHDPHNIEHGREAAAHYNGICRNCHGGAFAALVSEGRHTDQAGCIDCHMPRRRPMDVVHIVKTDHYIQRRPPAGDLLREAAEFRETQTNSYRGKVVPYYPDALPRTRENDIYVAVAQLRDRSYPQHGIADLTALLQASPNSRPEPWYELGAALQGQGQPERAIAEYRESLKRDPEFPAALLGLGSAFRQSGQLVQAADTFQQAVQAAPDNPKAWNELGGVQLDLDRRTDAAASLQRAVALEPRSPQAHNGLGVLLAKDDFPAAEKEFREAIRLLPNYGEAHGNLAGVLDLEHDLKQALYEFALAVRLSPGDAGAHFNYGAVLSRERRFDEARAQMEAAVRANPDFAEAHEMLGRLYERENRTEGAIREYRAAVNLNPAMSQAQLDLGAMLAKSGARAEAAEHLRQAAGASDPNLRNLANDLLRQLGDAR